MLSLLRLLTSEAHTLAAHAEAYADLAADEIGSLRRQWLRSVLAWAFAGVCLLVALTLAGVALMLWATLPVVNADRQWLLVAVPAVPSLAAIIAIWLARRVPELPPFSELRTQIRQDFAMLQEGMPR